VIFVHGSPGSLSAFIQVYADSSFASQAKLIAVDRPGFGTSDYGDSEPSLEKQAMILKPLVEEQQRLRPVILVGHSMGGPVVARMAMDYGELIDGIVLVAGAFDPDLEPTNQSYWRAPLSTPFLKWILPRWFRASNDELYRLKPELIKMIPLWPNIKQAVIIIQGGKDNLVPPGNADFAKTHLINAASVEIMFRDDMNHFVPWEHPELITEGIRRMFLKLKK
jgi:pimeloyl-ACP methyl ester carboxylesterase